MELLFEVFENLSSDVRGLYTWPVQHRGFYISAKKYSEVTRLSPYTSDRNPVLAISTWEHSFSHFSQILTFLGGCEGKEVKL